ncbi:MAG TPA: hypothetical protein VMT85_17580 [Thermoanaerobaculia bacterium]|nr:hypothetical protein [Thermoanaerobaculia bacterium]
MEYQIDARNQRSQVVRVGRDDQEIGVFRKASFFIHNLEGKVDGIEYQMKLAAPWTGFRYLLRQGGRDLASAKRQSRLHAFEASRPLIRHRLVEFELDVQGRHYRLTPEDRHGLTHGLHDGDERCGRLAMRPFEAQQGGSWQADLEAPADWSAPLAAFVAWLAREGRRLMES